MIYAWQHKDDTFTCYKLMKSEPSNHGENKSSTYQFSSSERNSIVKSINNCEKLQLCIFLSITVVLSENIYSSFMWL